jgi:hypothetical protein
MEEPREEKDSGGPAEGVSAQPRVWFFDRSAQTCALPRPTRFRIPHYVAVIKPHDTFFFGLAKKFRIQVVATLFSYSLVRRCAEASRTRFSMWKPSKRSRRSRACGKTPHTPRDSSSLLSWSRNILFAMTFLPACIRSDASGAIRPVTASIRQGFNPARLWYARGMRPRADR